MEVVPHEIPLSFSFLSGKENGKGIITLLPVLGGRHADSLREHPPKMGHIVESDPIGYFRHLFLRLFQ